MNIRQIFINIGLLTTTTLVAANPQVVVFDQISAVVYQNDLPDFVSKDDLVDDIVVITQQDVARRGFDGRHYTADQLVQECLFDQKSKQFKMSLSDEDLDRNLEKMGLTPDQLVFMADRHNFADVDELKAALKRMYSASMSQGFETEAGLVIGETEVQDYYDKHPVWLEAEYEVQTAFVPAAERDQVLVKSKLEKLIKTGKGYNVAWEEPVLIKQGEISANNKFLANLGIGKIHLKPNDNGFDLFKMVNVLPKRLQPLGERKAEIVNILRNERYPTVMEQVQKNILSRSSVTYPIQVQ